MTTSFEAPRPIRRRTATRRLTVKIVVLAVLASVALGGALSWTMARGGDPALRAKAGAAAAKIQPARRIVKTVVIKRVVASPGAGSPSQATTAVAAPVSAAPAPAPAPVTSGTS